MPVLELLPATSLPVSLRANHAPMTSAGILSAPSVPSPMAPTRCTGLLSFPSTHPNGHTGPQGCGTNDTCLGHSLLAARCTLNRQWLAPSHIPLLPQHPHLSRFPPLCPLAPATTPALLYFCVRVCCSLQHRAGPPNGRAIHPSNLAQCKHSNVCETHKSEKGGHKGS